MLTCIRIIEKTHLFNIEKVISTRLYSAEAKQDARNEFRVLNLKKPSNKLQEKRKERYVSNVLPPRTEKMATDQDWGNVWPGPRSFHPATVPLPIRQGYVEKDAPPDKYANAELVKIPNFLHLTPPVIERQCKALKKFCTPWPKELDTDEKIEKHFPIEITSSDYCFSSPSIRNPLARIVTLRFKLGALNLNERAKDKFLRLVGDKYDKDTGIVTIVTDRCPLKKQNYDYAMYLLTALFHESWNVEPWEALKSEADMEHYVWNKNKSKVSVEMMFGRPSNDIPNIDIYSNSVDKLMNEGESDYTLGKYGEAVRKLLNLPNAVVDK